MNIGEKIKEFRQKRGLSQKQLGELCGMADSAIRRYENGRAKPKLETLERIIEALDLSTAETKEIYLSSCSSFGAFWDDDERKQNESELLNSFRQLNVTGQKEAIKRTAELAELRKYTEHEPTASERIRNIVNAFPIREDDHSEDFNDPDQ